MSSSHLLHVELRIRNTPVFTPFRSSEMTTSYRSSIRLSILMCGFITKASVSSTMGRGVTVSRDSVLEMSGFKK